MMNRRSFIASILATGVAPYVMRAGILMPVRALTVVTPDVFFGNMFVDGVHGDDANDGRTLATPKRSINSTRSVVSADGTLYVANSFVDFSEVSTFLNKRFTDCTLGLKSVRASWSQSLVKLGKP